MRYIIGVVIVLAGVGAGVFWWLTEPRPALPRTQWQAYEQGGDPGRGRLVFYAGGCASCHASPGQSDPLRLGGGLELKSPVGSFYPPTISPDPSDGIGAWKVVDLANAMLSGV